MKTITIVVVLMMLTAPTWADEPTKNEMNVMATSNEPIVLSEEQLDGITAGEHAVKMERAFTNLPIFIPPGSCTYKTCT